MDLVERLLYAGPAGVEAAAELTRLRAEVERLRHPWRNVDEKDWEHLPHDIANSGHGQFWKAVLAEMRAALAAGGNGE